MKHKKCIAYPYQQIVTPGTGNKPANKMDILFLVNPNHES